MGILFKNADRFSGCLRVLIHCLMPTFHEHCSSFHQGEKKPGTVSGRIRFLALMKWTATFTKHWH